mmetsp:Transcript_37369/g.6696  ORF Transcript_37369/g.6696 Transcript_37369/m.6696 type:complete len:85 (-) Transcript_37369:1730-1984(-)
MLLAIYNSFTVPIFVSFRIEETEELFILNGIIDTMFVADIVLNFFSTYIDRNGEEVLDHKKIVKNYLKKAFIIDLIASLPLDLV